MNSYDFYAFSITNVVFYQWKCNLIWYEECLVWNFSLKLIIFLSLSFFLSKFQMHIKTGSVPWEWCQATQCCSVAAEGAFWNSGTWILVCQLERWRVTIVLSMPCVLTLPTFLLQLSKFFPCDFSLSVIFIES